MFGIPHGGSVPTPQFHHLLLERVCQLIDASGLTRATDVQEEAHMGPLGIFAEVDDEDAPEYDDRPAIEKVFARVSSAAKRLSEPRAIALRTLGCLPDTCAAVIIIDTGFTPVSSEGELISGLGKWSLTIEDDTAPRRHYGNVKEVAKLKAAFEDVKTTCDRLQALHGLASPVKPPTPEDMMRQMREATGTLLSLGALKDVPGPAIE